MNYERETKLLLKTMTEYDYWKLACPEDEGECEEEEDDDDDEESDEACPDCGEKESCVCDEAYERDCGC